MILELENLKQYGIPIDHLTYRGFDIDFYEDVSGHQLIAVWEDKIFEFGVYNTQAKEDMKLLVNEKLDTVTRFGSHPQFYGAKLEYFENSGFRDLRLCYRGRVIKIWRTPTQDDLPFLQQEAQQLLIEELSLRKNQDLPKM
jgi:hypothetical protein